LVQLTAVSIAIFVENHQVLTKMAATSSDSGKRPAIAPPEWDLLLSAAQKNQPDRIRDMINKENVDASHANAVGQSALHIAALWGHGTFVK
jgi:hypothetical protein